MNLSTITFPNDQVADFCRRWKINELSLFGSALREDFGPDSDVDLLVELRKMVSGTFKLLAWIGFRN